MRRREAPQPARRGRPLAWDRGRRSRAPRRRTTRSTRRCSWRAPITLSSQPMAGAVSHDDHGAQHGAPGAAMSTSGHPWMPTESRRDQRHRRGDDHRVDDDEDRADAASAIAAQADRTARMSDRLGHAGCRHDAATSVPRPAADADGERRPRPRRSGRACSPRPRRQERPAGRSRHRRRATHQRDPSSSRPSSTVDPAGGGVLDGVLHRLDAAEVERRLDVSADAGRLRGR